MAKITRKPQVGDAIWYTGDRANLARAGNVSAVYSTQWGEFFDIRWTDDDRICDGVPLWEESSRGLTFTMLSEPGDRAGRFFFCDEWQAHCRAMIHETHRPRDIHSLK